MTNETIQYFHDQHNGLTYAVDVTFNREDLLECIHHFDKPINFSIGMAILHPNDNYCKKTGREVSASKIKPTMLYFHSSMPSSLDKEKLYLEFNTADKQARYRFRINKKSDKPHFIEVY